MSSGDEYRLKLGARIRGKRESAGISIRKFSLMVGIHRNYMTRIELGHANPSIEVLKKIAHGLDVDVSELIREDNTT
jgi:transcriptional regulator with XRE-family HTH domain